ncbi:hypothetical protein SLS56_003378 [Neofusicoccum ribis]|uniref:Zn(2)-C6 fungal-type domain-containing protein n=1 Tax=Neofusicoccum ribis TaxID=45134 RepID=A0ABR3T014_9PEZI
MTRFALPKQLSRDPHTPRLNPSYRRNGKLQSCEPCRKGKLRCDHIMPACGRCMRRNKQDQCVYHPAPLTRPRSTATPRLSEPVLSPPQTASPEAASPPTQPVTSASAPLSVADDDSNEQDLQNLAAADVRHHAGFLGSTSYSAVLTENEGSLGLGQDEPDCHSTSNPRISSVHIQKGVEILSLLKDMPIFDRYIQRWYTTCQGIITIEPILKQWASSLWSSYGDALQNQDLGQLKSLSEHVWHNTDQRLRSETTKTAHDWIELSTGKNLRWEVVGIILTLVGMVATTLPDWDPLLAFSRRYKTKRSLIVALYRAADTCLKFCEEICIPNDIGMWLMYEVNAVYNFLHGDSCYDSWQKTGRTLNAIMALGWHQEVKSKDLPFFLVEIRKRLVASAFAHDKWLCAFLGRPPRLSYRYCVVQLPLDLTDRQLLSHGSELEAALATLDSEGWSKGTRVQRRTWSRAWVQYCTIREDILELSIGAPVENMIERAREIQHRAEQTWDSLPEYLRQDPEDIWHHQRPPIECLYLVFIHIEHLYNEFLLQRALIKRAGADTRELLQVAVKLLAAIIMVAGKREVLREFQDSHLMTIQDLSVFANALAWVPVDEPSSSICAQGRKFIKRILDKILSPESRNEVSMTGSEMPTMGMDLSVPFSGNDSEFMPWLESIDWDSQSWTMFS